MGDEYILARMDIVAFSELSRSNIRTNVFDSIVKISSDSNESIRRMAAAGKKNLRLECRGLYGDTIDVYFKTGDHDGELVLMLLNIIAEAQRTALSLGFFIKGAVVRGELLIAENVFTGPAMVDAHRTESDCPFPCITIAEDVIDIIDRKAREIFRSEQDMIDYRAKIIDGRYLNYIEFCSPERLRNNEPELCVHKGSLILTVEHYIVTNLTF